MPKSSAPPFNLKASLLAAFATSNRITCYLIENIPSAPWSAKPPEGAGRSIAAMAAHIHNVRLMWLKAVGAPRLPAKLDTIASQKDAIRALNDSHRALAAVLSDALDKGPVKSFKPDAAAFFAYLIAHDAHHRGQIASLARRLGHPIAQSVTFGMWEWGSRAKEL